MNLKEKLMNIQNELKAPKGQRNSFGNYNYRSCEDILEAVKPLLKKYNCTIKIEDMIMDYGERLFIQAKTNLLDCESEDELYNYALAELDKHKGMSADQCTGTASSYARKYALNGLFAIDDTKDADTDEVTKIKKKAENKEIEKSSKEEFKVTEEPEEEQIISEKLLSGLQQAINKNNIDSLVVQAILESYDYKSLREIKNKDYMKIVNDLKGSK